MVVPEFVKALSLTIPFFVLRTKERQELYYTLYDTSSYTTTQFAYELVSDVDGVIKALDFSWEVSTTYTYTVVSQISLYKVEIDSDHAARLQEPYEWGNLAGNTALVYSGYAEHIPDLVICPRQAGESVYFHKRMSRNCLKYDDFVLELNMDGIFDDAFAAGVCEFLFQILIVVSPYKQGYDKSLEPMKMLMMVNTTGEAKTYFSAQLPCAGYLTNAYMTVVNIGGQTRSPFTVVITPDIAQRTLVNQAIASTVSGLFYNNRLVKKNAFACTFGSLVDANETEMPVYYKHFGRQYVKLSGRKYLHFFVSQYQSDVSTSRMIQMVADYVPFRNTNFKQRWMTDDFDILENFWGGYIFPVDLKEAYLVMTSNITVGDAMMEVRLHSKTDQFAGTSGTAFSSTASELGDVYDTAVPAAEHIKAAIHELDLVPLASTVGAQTRTIPVGSVKAGDRIVLDFHHLATITGTLYFHILGKVANANYSVGSAFMLSPQIVDVNAMESKIGVNV